MPTDSNLPKHSIRISKRAKHIRLQICNEKGLVVILPQGAKRSLVTGLLEDRREWINQAIGKLNKHRQTLDDFHGSDLPHTLELPTLGLQLNVVYLADSNIRRCTLTDNQLFVPESESNISECRRLLSDWLRKLAKKELPKLLRHMSNALKMTYERTSIRSQKTRWGSCSTKGTISLNWKLILLPKQWTEYIMLHELCHTRHLNHSHRFWDLVAKHEPDHRQIEADMKHAWKHLPPWIDG